jgi:EAL domain-containing protein (putative c-di-GMP-specific phosphodiesterase class I)/CRP-like cAMP-binding protein
LLISVREDYGPSMQQFQRPQLARAPGLSRPPHAFESNLVVEPGTVIFREGERGSCAYVIERGRVEISVERSGQKIVLGHRGPGEVFGEMAVIDDKPRSATVRAVEPCDLLMVTREQLTNRIEQTDPVLRMCLTVILERFRSTLLCLQVIDHEAPGVVMPSNQPSSDPIDGAVYDHAIREIKLEQDLRDALRQEQFELHYQPIVDLAGGGLAGFEALIRWRHRQRGWVPPMVFIPTAEASGLIVPIGQWTLRHACGALQRIVGAAPDRAPPFVSVNLSGRDFYDGGFVVQVERALDETGIDPGRVKLEITETILMAQPETAAAALLACRSMGVSIAIDDFGTGYSSLSYLHQFPIDTLKIDRNFVSSMHASEQHHQIVRSIVHLAKELGIKIIAEGIERAEQAALLRQLGCDFGQGFLFARPLAERAAIDFFRQERPTPDTTAA